MFSAVGRFCGETDQIPSSSFYDDFGAENEFLQSQKKIFREFFDPNVL
jgi:hypothetical protein